MRPHCAFFFQLHCGHGSFKPFARRPIAQEAKQGVQEQLIVAQKQARVVVVICLSFAAGSMFAT